jgi:sugar fermentation stimulation protein A
MVEAGQRAVMLFVIQRTDCDAFSACAELDPAYARGLTEAATRGVEVLAYACEISTEAVRMAAHVPWVGAA